MNVSISLAPFDRGHIEQARRWRNDYEIWRWCRQSDLITDAAQEDWYERQRKDPAIRMYAIAFAVDGVSKVVGICGLTSICFQNRRAEFSLYVGREHQGKGFGSGALRALLTHGFQNLGLNVIWGETFDGNPALKTFAKLGFRLEGTRRQFYWKDGRFIDTHLIAMDAKTWTSLTSQSSESSLPSSQDFSSASSPSQGPIPSPEGGIPSLSPSSEAPKEPQNAESQAS